MRSIDGTGLRAAEVAAAAGAPISVALTPEARGRIERSAGLADEVVVHRELYGRSTGVGANRGVLVDPVPAARDLLRSHAASAGPLRSPERVRAMLLIRLNQLAAGGSGASAAAADGLAAMLRADALPAVREYGSIGTGDLSALATTALALAGESPTTRPLPAPVDLGPRDALPLLSSNAGTLADAALATAGHLRLARATLVVAAITFTAVRGNPEAFSLPVEQVTPFAGARAVCRSMRALTAGGAAAARLQDPFGLRTLPQVHGVTLDALARLDDVITRLVNAPSENPVLLADPPDGADAADAADAADGRVAHHGGFHAAYLAAALDATAAALAGSGALTMARLATLTDASTTGLEPFLAAAPGASGVMVLEYVGASALATIRAGAHPVALQGAVLSRGLEEDASFASTAARSLLGALEPARVLLSCELVAAVRAVRAIRAIGAREAGPRPVLVTRALELCADLPEGLADRDLTPDLDLADGLWDDLAALVPAWPALQAGSSSGRSSSA